ncbi:MAG: hypothetical protein WC477_07320 [Patescibacteria group bacterium]
MLNDMMRNPFYQTMPFDWLLRTRDQFLGKLEEHKSDSTGSWLRARIQEIVVELKTVQKNPPFSRWVGMPVNSNLFQVPLENSDRMLREEGVIVRYQPGSVGENNPEMFVVRFKDDREVVHSRQDIQPIWRGEWNESV